MPLRKIKKEDVNSLSLEWVLQVKNYKLDLDKKRCAGCQICTLACPKDAVKTEMRPKLQGERSQKAKVDIDLAKCNFCGICDILCPFGAIKLTINGQRMLSVVDKKSFPTLIRHLRPNPKVYSQNRVETEESCPLKLIRVSYTTTDGKIIENPELVPETDRGLTKAVVNIDEEHCPCCTMCEAKLPLGAIEVRKFLSGKINIDQNKCPAGCTDCLEACPITGALFLSDVDNKVYANEAFCVYCGACKAVCPVEDALELKRTHIEHTPVRSGAWNKALERLTSPADLTKELKTRSSFRARDSVIRRLRLEEEQGA